MNSITPLFPPPVPTVKPFIYQPYVNNEKLKKRRRYDSLKNILDTAKLFILIKDSLIQFPVTYLKFIQNSTINELSLANYKFPVKIKSISGAVNTNMHTVPINKSLIYQLYKYHTIFYNRLGISKQHLFGPGSFVVSRVAFNPAKTLACMYVATNCGELCGGGYIYFLIKKNKTWEIIEQHIIWIA